jgi:hypothetical protein
MPDEANTTPDPTQGNTGGGGGAEGGTGGSQEPEGTPPDSGTETENPTPKEGEPKGSDDSTPAPKDGDDDSKPAEDDDAGEEQKKGDDDKPAEDDASKGLDTIPESPDKYQIAIPEGVPRDENMEKVFRETAYALGLTQRQAQKLAEMQANRTKQVLEAQAQEAQKSIEKLQARWGANYDTNVQAARKALDVFGSPELHKLMDAVIPGTDMRFGDHPAVVEHFYAIGQAISESAIIRGERGGGGVPRTPAGDPMLRFPSLQKKE